MRSFLSLTASLLVATAAFAQTTPAVQEPAYVPATMPATAPTPAVPVPNEAPQAQTTGTVTPLSPTPPVVAPVTMAPAGVTSTPAVPASTTLATTPVTPAAQPLDINAAVRKLAGNANSQQQLGQVMVVGSIMGCTQKAAGKPQTDAFYQQMQALGQTVQGYCKQGNAPLARTTVLNTLTAKQNDPVVKAMLSCYDAQKANVSALGGQQVATDAEHYARWLRNPTLAGQEMQESDVCRKGKK